MATDQRIRSLDGMRGIAVLGVLLLHALPSALFWFWCWVDMFFVLSGYLITTIVLRNVHAGSFHFGNFFARRSLRIWPVYFATLAATYLLWLIKHHLGSIPEPAYEWWSSLVFVQNYQGYFGPWDASSTIVPFFRHSWSIAAEEQFYLLWPLTVLLCRANAHLLVLLMLGYLATGVWMRSEGYLLILLLTRIDGIVMGVLLAIVCAEKKNWYSRFNRTAAFCTALLVGGALAGHYIYTGYASGVDSYGDIAVVGDWTWNVTGFALFFYGLTGLVLRGRLAPLTRFLSQSWLVGLGVISYAMYMTQGVVRASCHMLLQQLEVHSHLLSEILTIALVIAVSALSWRYFEKPINALKRHFPIRGVVAPRLPG